MNYPTPPTVTASERERWRVMAVGMALADDAPLHYGTPGRQGFYVNLVDPVKEQLITTYHVLPAQYWRLIVEHTVHVTRNVSAGHIYNASLPTGGPSSYVRKQATYESLNPEDPNCIWYFWIGGERWWEPDDEQ